MRVGICGYGGSGKDVVADVLVAEFGFVKVNMSDALDKYLRILNPLIPSPFTEGNHVRYDRLRAHTDYVTAKKIPEVRELLQRLGTDVGRAIDPEMWVKQMELEASKHANVVTTGIRFTEECAPLDVLIHVDRDGYGPVNNHISDSLDDIFALAGMVIRNDGTLDDLRGYAAAAGRECAARAVVAA